MPRIAASTMVAVVLSNPVVTRNPQPSYSQQAMRAKLQGTVVLDAVILPDGTVGDVRVTRSLDATFGLDDAAIIAVKRWTFQPATDSSGKAVTLVVSVQLSFRLH